MGLFTRFDLCATLSVWERIWLSVFFSSRQLDKEEESRVLFTQKRFELADIVGNWIRILLFDSRVLHEYIEVVRS